MYTLCFFPWLRLGAPLQSGGFELRTMCVDEIVSGDSPFCPEQQDAVQAVVASFRDGSAPLESFTLLSFRDRGLLDHLSDEDVAAIGIFSQLLTVSGLSARRFFHSVGYQNSDNFLPIVQNFVLPFNGVAVPARRRDGSSTTFFSRGSHLTLRPLHVSLKDANPVDLALLESLCSANQTGGLDGLFDGIVQFNLANTDQPNVHRGIEVVQIVSAFEQVLGCHIGREGDLVEKLLATLKPAADLPPERCHLLGGRLKYRLGTPIREYWIRDLYQIRGHLAHGRLRAHTSTWTSQAHLLLAAYAFPLVLKAKLQERKFYAFQDADTESVNAFEYLLSRDLFAFQEPTSSYPWNDLLEEARWENVRRKILNDDRPGV